MVYVLNQDGQPIMPTVNHAKVRILLKNGKAKVIKRCERVRTRCTLLFNVVSSAKINRQKYGRNHKL